MGLKGTINKAVNSAFKVLGKEANDGLLKTVTYKSVSTQGTFNPTTGAFTESTFTTYTLDAVEYGINIREVDNEKIKVGDRRIMFQTSEVPSGFTPQLVDSVVIGSTTYVVKHFKKDPADAAWVVLIRSA